MNILLAYDVETTSNMPETTRVVQVAAMAVTSVPSADGQTVTMDVWEDTLCNPGMDISDGAFAIHGISNEDVANAEPDEAVMYRLYIKMAEHKDQVILTGHNCRTFDIPILNRLAKLPDLGLPVIDTLICSARCHPDAPSHKLGELTTWLKLGDAAGAHDAMADIKMVLALVNHFSKGLGMSWRELAAWCSEARVLKVCHFGKHRGKPWGRGTGCVPYWYAKYMAENFSDPTPDMEATIKHHYGLRFKNKTNAHNTGSNQ